MKLDIEKAFDSVNHFIKWIQILMQNQESCFINGGATANYLELERGTRQDDPISAHLFIIFLMIASLFIMQNENINALVFLKKYYYKQRMQMILTVFLKEEKSVTELMKTFDIISTFSVLKPNKSKCEIDGFGTLKGVRLVFCEMECTDLCLMQLTF